MKLTTLIEKALKNTRTGTLHRRIPRAVAARLFFKLKSGTAPQPSVVYLVVNSVCNLRCKMCDVGLQNKDSQFYKNMIKQGTLSLKKFKQIIDKIKKFRAEIAITSTEPLLYPHLIPAIRYIKRNGLACQLTTNGALLSHYAKQLVNAGLDKLYISIDGPAEVHDKIRGVKGTFKRLDRGIQLVKECKKQRNTSYPQICSNTVVMEDNYDRLVETVRLLRSIGIEHIMISHLNWVTPLMAKIHNAAFPKYPATAMCVSEIDLSDLDIEVLHQQVRQLAKEFPRSVVSFVPHIESNENLEQYYFKPNKFIDNYTKCLVPWCSMQIAVNGDVIVSTRCALNVKFGNVFEDKVDNIWQGKNIKAIRRALAKRPFPVCSRCCGVF